MGWRVFGEVLKTADIATTPNKRVYQRVKFNDDVILRAFRTWFVFYNNPVFTGLTFDIYANDEQTNLPSTKITSSSTVWTKAQLISLDHGVKSMYFNFNDVALQKNTFYHFIPRASGYTGTDNSHLAWRKGWPDPTYTKNLTTNYNTLLTSPYMMSFVGAGL